MTTGLPTTTEGPAGLRWRDGLVPVLVGWVWARCCVAETFFGGVRYAIGSPLLRNGTP